PVQAITPDSGKQVCYVASGVKSDRREVEIGEFNDEFIEIKNGLKEGERVLLHPPEGMETETPGQPAKSPQKEKNSPSAPATLPASSPVQAKKAAA
ncbi:MAG: hypothetical protein ACREIC_31705, partial [Limisphaerales bacterium]